MRLQRVERAAIACLATSAIGTAMAIRSDEPARFAGLRLSGGNVALDFAAGGGTAFSAPLPVLATFAALVRTTRSKGARGRTALRLVALAGACFAVGQAGEPVTWRTLREPRRHLGRTVVVVGNLTIPAYMSVAALKELRR